MSVFDFILLGHLVGDYLFQNKWMAMNKSASHFKCLVHSAIYTLAVCAITLPVIQDWRWGLIVFVSHYPIDRWGLADRWLDLIHGRSLRDFLANGGKNVPYGMDAFTYVPLRAGFTAVVYTVVDNTMHLILMLLGWWLIK